MAGYKACKHCAGWFRPIRSLHYYCSDTCRKLAHKAKKSQETKAALSKRLATKLAALSSSVFGRYVCREILRAGTVQILTGHTSESLALLAALRRRCTAASGYKRGSPLGAFELGHIYPVSGKDRLGLLHPSNLVICPKEFNRKHARSLPVEGYFGLSLPISELDEKWSIKDGMTSVEILKLSRKFIGVEFDNWLKSHQISVSQQSQLIKKLEAEGLPKRQLLGLRLEELKALADEEEVPYFSMDKDPDESWLVVRNEYRRLLPTGELNQFYDYIAEIDQDPITPSSVLFLGEMQDFDSLLQWIVKTGLLQLHGQPHNLKYKRKCINSYFKNVAKSTEALQKSKSEYIDSIELGDYIL